MDFRQTLSDYTAEAERVVRAALPEAKGHSATVIEAMRYSVEAGGKRLRPMMMLASYRMCGGQDAVIEPFMAAIELIHSYSLVHDDLPEMDDDALRRGLPTTHIRYGQAMAVLAGDGLLNYAYETMHRAFALAEPGNTSELIQAMTILAQKAGIYGMVGGQCLDVEAEKKDLTLTEEQLLYVYENKTAALLQAALTVGATLAGADKRLPGAIAALERAGYDLGIAFQLQDDILDIRSTTEELGKPVGSDIKNGKKTYVSYLGLEAAEAEQQRLSREAAELIGSIRTEEGTRERDAQVFLIRLVEQLADRKK